MNAFVEATLISLPAWIGTTASASLAIVLAVMFTSATVGTSRRRSARSAASVSAVSPDWEIRTAAVRPAGPPTQARSRNSEPMSTSTGSRASSSNQWRATPAA